ncbi:hypothetical protein [Nocardioides donggukensis]|uniref:Uncharacterized protein n=1 Tax=Nocardioides donggukensis TaxID=2774019 RepID=A0A927PZY3_9ACTN|nr:hypothetical protein [Nocardioides donggukensis]MBD8870928.1 hypothetical protein [Nocardioides donggukensis]
MTAETKKAQPQTLTASAAPKRPSLLTHIEAKQAKQAQRLRLREDRRVSRAH